MLVDQMEGDISRTVPTESRGERLPLEYCRDYSGHSDTERLLDEDIEVLTKGFEGKKAEKPGAKIMTVYSRWR